MTESKERPSEYPPAIAISAFIPVWFLIRLFPSSMRHVAAYLLAVLGGNESPSAKDIKAILSSVGVEEDSTSLDKVISELKGKSVEEIIEEGSKKLASMPAGGAAPAAAGGAAPAAGGAPAAEKKKESEPEESDDDMGMGLFD